MAGTTETFCRVVGINTYALSKYENRYLEADFLVLLMDTLKHVFKEYYQTIIFQMERRNMITDAKFLRHLIKDLITTENFTINGIARATHLHEDVVYEIAMGINKDPSTSASYCIMKLHQLVKPQVYKAVVQKVIQKCDLSFLGMKMPE